MKQFTFLILLSFLSSCILFDNGKHNVYITDDDYVEHDRQFSPDSSKMLLKYASDIGAYGFSRERNAILGMADTNENLTDFTLPALFSRLNWIDNNSIAARIDIIPSIRSGQSIMFHDTIVNGVNVKVFPFDYIEPDSKMVIEHRETSPDGKHELIAYRYFLDTRNLNFIHVSVIEPGRQIPRYGNYLIADMLSDYVLNGKWDKDNTLIFFTNKLYADMIQYFLVHNHPRINYKVVIDDTTYGNKYLWIDTSSR